jgi:hypothetical protein
MANFFRIIVVYQLNRHSDNKISYDVAVKEKDVEKIVLNK